MRLIKPQFLFFFLLCTAIACKKETSPKEKFDLNNYAIQHVYRETNGNGKNYYGPLQLLIYANNNKLNIKHTGTISSSDFPNNITSFCLYDIFYNNNDSLLIKIDTTKLEAVADAKYGRIRDGLNTNLIDIREKNWDLNNLKLSGDVLMYNNEGVVIDNRKKYIAFNNDGSKMVMQQTPITASTAFTNTVIQGETTNYFREFTRGDASYQERLFFVFAKNKITISGTYLDFITHNTFYYFGEITK